MASTDELLTAQFGVILALLNGLMEQGAVDRERLRSYVEALVADLSPEEKSEAYGFLLQRVVEHLERTDPDKTEPPPSPGALRH